MKFITASERDFAEFCRSQNIAVTGLEEEKGLRTPDFAIETRTGYQIISPQNRGFGCV